LLFNWRNAGVTRNALFWLLCAMCLSKCVATCDQRSCFGIVHRHCTKCTANVGCRGEGIRNAVWTFWIDVDQTHLRCRQWPLQIALCIAALVRQQFGFRPPEHEIRLPCVDATTCKAKGFEAHIFHGNIAGKDHQVAP